MPGLSVGVRIFHASTVAATRIWLVAVWPGRWPRPVPGVLSRINRVFSGEGINISGQYLMTNPKIGYVVIDVEANERSSRAALKSLSAIESTIRARVLF